MAQFIIW